jgi:23S rRNA (cytidine1920-2'-O)/16S rRNA (cytidine1409-2'-O)-methyltransferase
MACQFLFIINLTATRFFMAVNKERLDKLLLQQGLASSRQQAQALILAGQVLVNEQRIDKAGQLVARNATLRIKGEKPRYVSRAGDKLAAALAAFGVDPCHKVCLDVGASTGGFTDCLLQHQACQVFAIDVGHNQLVWSLRQDARVVVREGVNARYLQPHDFPQLFPLITVDVSFISLTKIIPALSNLLTLSGQLITLIKPQFEVGPQEVGRKGIVRDPAKHQRVIQEVAIASLAVGLNPQAVIASPVIGADGNQEFLALFNRHPDSRLRPSPIDTLKLAPAFITAIDQATKAMSIITTNAVDTSNV